MNAQLQQQLNARISAFAADITNLLQGAVADAIASSLSGGVVAKRGPGRPKGSGAAKRGPGRPPKAAKAKASRGNRKKGEKRTAAELDRLTESLYKEIARNADRRIELIAKSMGVPTKDLALPVKKLIDAKRIKTKGQRRATSYSVREASA